MSNLTIPLDPTNPGHFFACCGLLDLLTEDIPELTGSFTRNPKRPRLAEFHLAPADPDHLRQALLAVSGASYSALPLDGEISPISPIRVASRHGEGELDWWLRPFRDRALALKGWGGQVTSEKLFQDLSLLVNPETPADRLFFTAAPTSSRFGVDPRSAWNAIDLGYSPNEQNQEADSFPNVELLAAYGLQRFRPSIGPRRLVPYFLWAQPLHRSTASLAAFHAWPGLPGEWMAFPIEGRGQSYKYFAYAKRKQDWELAQSAPPAPGATKTLSTEEE